MDCKHQHQEHEHVHGRECGHTAISHGGQAAYLHDGHLHVAHGEHFDCAAVEVSSRNPDRCTPQHACVGHPANHVHGPGCGHERVPHGSHVDYLVDDHLHHAHGEHCDDHGTIDVQHGSRAA